MVCRSSSRNIRHYANKFSHPARASSGERFYMGSRPYSSNKFDYAKAELERIQRKMDAMKEKRRESLGLDPPVCRKIDAMKEKHRESLGFDPSLNFSHRKLFATVSSPPKNFSHRKLFATVFSDISRITRDGQQQ